MAGTGLVAGEVVVDALPYFDQGYEAPGVREAAAALVEEETRRYRPTKNYLSYLTAPDYSAFETDIMRNEFERLAARQPIELLSMKRYELPAPSSGQKNDITAWQECVNNSMAQLEHQAVRIENLELMSQHGCNAWKVYNENLVHMIEHAQKELQKLSSGNPRSRGTSGYNLAGRVPAWCRTSHGKRRGSGAGVCSGPFLTVKKPGVFSIWGSTLLLSNPNHLSHCKGPPQPP
nr:pre-mRNA-splicing factor SPF27 isoform X1 [Marmota flaviventris]